MHVGVVGTGRLGSFRARTLKGFADTKLTLVDRNRERGAALARELEATAVVSTEQAIDSGIDALVISTSTASHAELVEVGLEARLPVFCEKPISLDLDTTARLAEVQKVSNVPVQVGFQRRFDPGFRRAREMVQTGVMGRVYTVRMIAHDHEPPPEGFIGLAGGQYRDMHVHDFDIISWVTGQAIVEIYAEGSVLVDEAFKLHDDIDTSAALLRLADGALGILSGTRHDPLGYDVRMELHGFGDSIAVGWDERTPLRSLENDHKPTIGAPYKTFFERFEHAFHAELAEFLRVARGEVESPSTIEESRQSLRVAIAAEQSRRERRPIRIASEGN